MEFSGWWIQVCYRIFPGAKEVDMAANVMQNKPQLRQQDAQLSQRDRAAGCVIGLAKCLANSGRLELGDNIYGHYRSIFNHCDIIGRKICWIRLKNKRYYGAQGHRGRYQSKADIRLPISDWLTVTGILSRTVSELSQLIVRILDTLHFWAPFEGRGVETTYSVHVGLIGKHVVVFPLVLIEPFSPLI